MDHKRHEQKVNDLTIKILEEEVTQERRLARIEARQIIYFGNGSEGICGQRGKAIEAMGKTITSINIRIATVSGALFVVILVLNIFRTAITKALFG